MTQALNNKGVPELYEAIQRHAAYLKESESGEIQAREKREHACINAAVKQLKRVLALRIEEEGEIKKIMENVRQGKKNPYQGADEMVKTLLNN
jgi:LAO/AO transport system kinase